MSLKVQEIQFTRKKKKTHCYFKEQVRLTLTSSLKTADWIILLLFNPPAISSKSITDLKLNKQEMYIKC